MSATDREEEVQYAMEARASRPVSAGASSSELLSAIEGAEHSRAC